MRVVYIQHPHEFKTNSADFFRKLILSYEITIDRVSRDEIDFEKIIGCDLIVCFQADSLLPVLSKLNIPILAVCMLDESLHQNGFFYRNLRNIRFLSFSLTFHNFLSLNGCNSNYLQYWPEVGINPFTNYEEVFFWERTPEHLSVDNVINSLGDCYNYKVRQSWDPGQKSIQEDSHRSHRIQYLEESWLQREEYLRCVKSAKIFVAPRKWEGIGLSILEALSYGTPVIGLNYPTANEYVMNKKNGFLINSKQDVIPNLDWDRMRMTTIEMVRNGSIKYQYEAGLIMEKLLDLDYYKDQEMEFALSGRITLRQFIYLSSGR